MNCLLLPKANLYRLKSHGGKTAPYRIVDAEKGRNESGYGLPLKRARRGLEGTLCEVKAEILARYFQRENVLHVGFSISIDELRSGGAPNFGLRCVWLKR